MFNIALNTFREIVRNKFFSLIIFFGVSFLLLSLVLKTLALGEIGRMLYDFGLSFIELTGFFVVLFLGGGMLYREIEGRTIYLLLSKPIARSAILIGKFLGFAVILALIVLFLSVILTGLLVLNAISIDPLLWMALLGIYLKLLSLLAVILFASTIASPILSMFVTIAAYFVGHNAYIIFDYVNTKGGVALGWIGKLIVTIFPNLESLNLKIYIATQAPLDISEWWIAYGASVLYIVLVLFLGVILFRSKSFDTV